MAKHEDPKPRTTLSRPEGTFQPNYSNQFLIDGTWYVTVVCPLEGLVDEAVSWDDAKTPHHAGVIADDRHQECEQKASDEVMREAGFAEIAAAEEEVRRADALLERVEAEFAALEESDDTTERELDLAKKRLQPYRDGPGHARRRLADIRKTNE